MSNLEAVLNQYEKNKTETTKTPTSKMSEEDRLKRYFAPFLDKNQSSGEKRIRIIPAKNGSPFVEVYFHEILIAGKWTKIYDPGMNNDGVSPLNETYSALMSLGDPKSKELAKQYKAKKFYIVKVIDRDNEADGPKFWRIKYNFKGEGILDKIIPVFKKKGDIADALTGRDLTLNLVKQKSNNGKTEYTNVTGVFYDDPTPLSEDASLAEAWINEPTTWTDVYSKKPLDYLQILATGKEPKWSTKLSKYIASDQKEEGSELASNEDASQFLQSDTDGVAGNSTEIDDLPF